MSGLACCIYAFHGYTQNDCMLPRDMFWGDRYASVKDPFGHSWTFATHVRDLSPEELAEAARQASLMRN